MKAYETLELEVTKFEAQDVITSSVVEDNVYPEPSPEVMAQIEEMLQNPDVSTVITDLNGQISGWEDQNGTFHPISEWK